MVPRSLADLGVWGWGTAWERLGWAWEQRQWPLEDARVGPAVAAWLQFPLCARLVPQAEAGGLPGREWAVSGVGPFLRSRAVVPGASDVGGSHLHASAEPLSRRALLSPKQQVPKFALSPTRPSSGTRASPLPGPVFQAPRVPHPLVTLQPGPAPVCPSVQGTSQAEPEPS